MSPLPDRLAVRLELEGPPLRALVTQLCDHRPATALRALDAVLGHLVDDGGPAASAPAALPYLLALATSRSYRLAAALLARISHLYAAIDDPPRSLAGAAGTDEARRVFDLLAEHAPALVDVARSSADPQAARLAATLAARHPEQDGAVEPLLVALMTGAGDADERASLLYALARIQLACGAPFHRRIAEAWRAEEPTPERFAIALALSVHDVPEPDHGRARQVLRAPPPGGADPRAFGRRLVASGLDPDRDTFD